MSNAINSYKYIKMYECKFPYDKVRNIEESLAANREDDPTLGSVVIEHIDKNGVVVATRPLIERGKVLPPHKVPGYVDVLLDGLKKYRDDYGGGALEVELHNSPNIVATITNAGKILELRKISEETRKNVG